MEIYFLKKTKTFNYHIIMENYYLIKTKQYQKIPFLEFFSNPLLIYIP